MVVMDDPGDWRTPGLMHGALRGLRGDFDILVTSSEVWERLRCLQADFRVPNRPVRQGLAPCRLMN